MTKNILVVDDEKAVRESFKLAYEDVDLKADYVDSGKGAIKKVQTNHYDLIFLDLRMPEMNGIQTLKEIRKIEVVFN